MSEVLLGARLRLRKPPTAKLNNGNNQGVIHSDAWAPKMGAEAANSRPATLLFGSRDRALKSMKSAVIPPWWG